MRRFFGWRARSRRAPSLRVQPQPVAGKTGPWAIGHRGFPTAAPENTLASFARAIEAGVDMVELDVTLTRDGVPVVIHDRTVNRTTGGKGRVRSLSFEAIRKLDAGGWFSPSFAGEKIPTLEEVLELAGGKVALNVEIKMEAVSTALRGGVEEKVLNALRRRGMAGHTVISSFLPLVLRRVKRLDPAAPTALLLARQLRMDPRSVAVRAQADALHLPQTGLSREIVESARRGGIPVRVYTVNDETAMKWLLDWEVDGIFTDCADRLVRLLKGRSGGFRLTGRGAPHKKGRMPCS